MLQVDKLSKFYGKHRGVKDISFTLFPSEVIGIVGSNGSGKTTTFRLLLGLLKQNTGRVIFEGKEVSKEDIGLFGYLPEDRSIYRDLTVFEQIALLGRLKGMSEILLMEKIDAWLNFLSIYSYKHRKLKELSKGNQQKVQLICAIIHDPKIVILDEPLTGLDIQNVQLFKKVIEVLKKEGKYILLSSHQYEYLEEFCQKVLFLKEGEVVYEGYLNDLKNKYDYFYLTIPTYVLYQLNYKFIWSTQIGEFTRIKIDTEKEVKSLMTKMIKINKISNITVEKPKLIDIIQENYYL